MSHLSAERLAALADAGEWPTPPEAAHLAQCRECAVERLAYETLLAGARAERDAVGVPLTRWEDVRAGLERKVPAVAERQPGVVDLAARRRMVNRMTQVAAGIALLLGGAVAGRVTAVAGPLAVRGGADAPAVSVTADPVADDASIPEFRSVDDAQSALARYSVAYQHAAAYLAEHDSTSWLEQPEDYRTRLIALERAGRTMREAMEEAPYDPVLTGYYLTTLGQREATLRQLNVALPATERLNSF